MTHIYTLEEGGTFPAAGAAPSEAFGAEPVFLVLDGRDVSVFKVDMPDLPTDKLNRVLPSIMEEMIAGDVADHHFALVSPPEENKERQAGLVAVIRRTVLDTALEQAQQQGINVAGVTCEYLLLAVPDHADHGLESCDSSESKESKESEKSRSTGPAVRQSGDCVLVRFHDGTGLKIEDSLTADVLDGVDTLEAVTVPPSPAISFLQGPYAPGVPFQALVWWFRRSAVLFFALVTVWGAFSYTQMIRNVDARDRFDTEAISVFRAAYPDVKRVVNVEAQARAKAASGSQAGKHFLYFTSLVTEAVGTSNTLALDAVRYDAGLGTYSVVLRHRTFSDAEEFLSALKAAGLSAQSGNSRQEGADIYTEITVGGVLR
ncbi:hypothetical protein GCM10017044_09630 [Kordiimonas sediminis]|uniref:GspL periplasmic domain-containing protein n=1 Tax=Kordiimonas sediminis TaxID=1735581 RepID=A0A919APQ8_9PROT|nr:type II secretion system protein GspL [Kordiimonas sediminis]GHF17331.1 hypothetical protein GCM10017044_09630 [Kordiimonas sediminis]